MRNVRSAFKLVADDVIPSFWKPVGVHIIIDFKMDLTREARLEANGNGVRFKVNKSSQP
jgi:hypothetical protein